MKPGIIYNLSFTNVENKLVTAFIYDNEVQIADDADEQIITLHPSGDPLHIVTIDNNEDKFSTIKAKRLVMSFNSTYDIGMATFADGPDDRFYVTAQIEDTIIFKGYLSLDDLAEDFMPPANVVTLVANDKLGALKDIPWTDNDGEYPQGKFRIADVISQCLKKTGLLLPLKVVNNLRHGNGQLTNAAVFSSSGNYFVTTDLLTSFFYVGQEITITGTPTNDRTAIVTEVDNSGVITQVTLDETITVGESAPGAVFTDVSSTAHFYDNVYLDAKTFEKIVGESESCYTVLQKILGEDCFLTQWMGEWLIVRVDEFDGNPVYVAEFDEDGDFVGFDSGASFDKNIGVDQDIYFINEATRVQPQRPNGHIKETFKYLLPKEIPCNVDFDRGTGDEPNPANPDQTINYEPECWEFFREGNSGTNADLDSSPVSGSSGVLVKRFENAYEKERYLMIETPSFRHYFKSQAIDVHEKDKITIGVDTRLNTNESVTNMLPVHVRLVAQDGRMWDWDNDTVGGVNEWVEVFSGDGWFLYPWRFTRTDEDDTEWKNISGTSKEFPADGKLYIRLVNGFASPVQVRWSNLTVTYIPYINGSHQKYSGQFNRVDRATAQNSGIIQPGYLAAREEEVFISDSPKKLFKGAMFLLIDGEYVLTSRFFTAAPFGNSYPPGPEYCHPYGYTQAFSVFNQYRNTNTIIQYEMKGDVTNAGFGEDPPDLIHKYSITDSSLHSIARNFMLLTFDHDLFMCESKGTMAEVYRTDTGKLYGDVFEFKYENAA